MTEAINLKNDFPNPLVCVQLSSLDGAIRWNIENQQKCIHGSSNLPASLAQHEQ